MQLGVGQRAVLLFELTATLPLLPLDPFTLLERQHLLVLDPQFPALEFEVVENFDDGGRFFGRSKVGKGQTTENTIVKVVVEGVGQGEVQLGHQLHQLFFLDGKRDVLDDDSGGDQFVIYFRSRSFWAHCTALERTGTETRGKGARDAGLLIQPGLSCQVSSLDHSV